MSLSEKLTGSLWDRIAGFFVQMWHEFWDATVKDLEAIGTTIIEFFIGRKGYKAYLDTINGLQKRLDEIPVPEHIQHQIDEFAKTHNLSHAFSAFLYMMATDIGYLINVLPTIMGREKLDLAKEYCNGTISLETLISVYYRNPELRKRAIDLARENGLCENDVKMVFEANQNMPTEDQLASLYLRGEISEGLYDGAMQLLGYEQGNIDLIKKLLYYIPSVSDLVTMAVRECFTPDIAEKYGQYQDFPEDFAKYAKMQGVSDFWAKAYWAAHWNLPSFTEGIAMFQRGIIDHEDLVTLLKALDVMPYWRDKLIQMTYSLYDRVDIRRMYRVGVLDEQGVYEAYRQLGYDEDKAKKITDFVVKEYGSENKDLTKTQIIDGYEVRLLSKDETIQALKDLGYSEHDAEFLIAYSDYKYSKKIKNLTIKNIEEMYKVGVIDDTETITRLDELNIPSEQAETFLREWQIKYTLPTSEFPTTDLHKLFHKGLIDEDTYKSELRKKKYNEKYINWYILLYKPTK